MPGKILCVAEKNSISKAVSQHLSGGNCTTVSLRLKTCQAMLLSPFQSNTRNQFIKNYSFQFDFGGRWGRCDVLMTCVSGHLTDAQFTAANKDWSNPPPESLFNAPIHVGVKEVRVFRAHVCISQNLSFDFRKMKRLHKTSPAMLVVREHYSFGPIVIGRGSILVER